MYLGFSHQLILWCPVIGTGTGHEQRKSFVQARGSAVHDEGIRSGERRIPAGDAAVSDQQGGKEPSAAVPEKPQGAA